MLNALTIDVEDYYQVSAFESVVRFKDWDQYESRVERNTDRILNLLDEHKTKATFFILGWVAERNPKLVKEIDDRGHEVASHGYSHRRIYTQSQIEFREETRRSKRVIEDIIGKPIIGYRGASYSITRKSLWALDILMEEGFRYDSSIFPVIHDLYGIPGHNRFVYIINKDHKEPFAEVPLSTIRLGPINVPVAGGGYLRLYPYSLTQWAIRHLNRKEKQPAIVYLHPWEVDPDQPKIKAGWVSYFRHHINQGGAEKKLKYLLRDFSFVPISQVI